MSAPTPARHATEKAPTLRSNRAKAAIATVVGVATSLLVAGVTSEGFVSAVLPHG
jgi:hypothetical protein